MIPTHEHWIVASAERGPVPTPAHHPSEHGATEEARRLARQNRNDRFVIYHAIAVVQAVDTHVTRLGGDEEPPF